MMVGFKNLQKCSIFRPAALSPAVQFNPRFSSSALSCYFVHVLQPKPEVAFPKLFRDLSESIFILPPGWIPICFWNCISTSSSFNNWVVVASLCGLYFYIRWHNYLTLAAVIYQLFLKSSGWVTPCSWITVHPPPSVSMSQRTCNFRPLPILIKYCPVILQPRR